MRSDAALLGHIPETHLLSPDQLATAAAVAYTGRDLVMETRAYPPPANPEDGHP
jgi:hypothetical protein